MCGFVGGFEEVPTSILSQSFNAALDLLQHRGPDSSGESTFDLDSGTLRFGFRRLAIIDLSDSANQPFTSKDKRFTMVFNGEIFNYLELKNELLAMGHHFRTDSDSEVLITAWMEWGIEAVRKFIGMFSIVIYDNLNSKLWCLRDAYGIKPFFFSHSNRSFFFASEIPALLKLRGLPPIMNQDVAMNYLICGDYDRSIETFFQDIYQLAPGHFIQIDLNASSFNIQSKRWWIPVVQENTSLSFEEAAEALREEFLSSVAMHMRSDVPVATALSGGLDSSAIVGAIRKIHPDIPIHTFSYMADDPRINEKQWIDLVNSETKAIAHPVQISAKDFRKDLKDLIHSQGEPFGSTSLYAQYKVYQAAKSSGVTVMLDGQGADELLAGYFGYPESRIQSLLDSRSYLPLIQFVGSWSKWPGRQPYQLLKSSGIYLLPRWTQGPLTKMLRRMTVPGFITKDFVKPMMIDDVFPDSIWKKRHLMERLLQEQSNGALIALLRHADRNSMRWSVESRVPFLNPRLSNLVFSFQEEYLLSKRGETKSVFRESMRGILSERVLQRKDKIGFATPHMKWVSKELLREDSFIEGLNSLSFIDPKRVLRFLSRDVIGEPENLNLKWRIYNLTAWRQNFDIQ